MERVLVQQYVDYHIGNNISNDKIDEKVQAISTDFDLLECLRLIEEWWLKANQVYELKLARLYGAKIQLTSYGNLTIYDSRMYVSMQWLSALAPMIMLSVTPRAWVPPMAIEVFLLYMVSQF